MAKKRKGRKAKAAKRRATPARRKTAARQAKRASAQPKRRKAKTALPPRQAVSRTLQPMTAPGPAVTPIEPRPSSFPSSVPGDQSTPPDSGKDN